MSTLWMYESLAAAAGSEGTTCSQQGVCSVWDTQTVDITDVVSARWRLLLFSALLQQVRGLMGRGGGGGGVWISIS